MQVAGVGSGQRAFGRQQLISNAFVVLKCVHTHAAGPLRWCTFQRRGYRDVLWFLQYVSTHTIKSVSVFSKLDFFFMLEQASSP